MHAPPPPPYTGSATAFSLFGSVAVLTRCTEHCIHNTTQEMFFHVPSISNKTYLLGICWQRDFFYSQLIYKHAGK